MLVIKKNGSIQEWKPEKIRGAILLANKRTKEEIDQKELERLSDIVKNNINKEKVTIDELHELVMRVLRDEGYTQTFNMKLKELASMVYQFGNSNTSKKYMPPSG